MFVEAIVSVGSMLLMGSYSGGGNGNCNFAGLESSASIDVAETKANGYFDLVERVRENPFNASKVRKAAEK